jgi:hypothetical protein
MTKPDHLNNDLLIRAIDDELPESEMIRVESHLAHCEQCRQAYNKLRGLTLDLESLLAMIPAQHSSEDRAAVEARIDARSPVVTVAARPRHSHPLAWGLALAASLTLGVLVAPHVWRSGNSPGLHLPETQSNTFEVAGELFSPLPYSNPDLPIGAPHIVRMQVPVSSLSDAGIVFEPVSNQALTADSSVLADVLLGMDGQPLGVHVLGVE